VAYEIEFTAKFTVDNPERYINDCCWGGDVIRDRLLPAVSGGYEKVQTGQEDWGWFIWMRHGKQRTHADIYCDDKVSGSYRIHIYGAQRKWLRLKLVDGDDIDHVKSLTVNEIDKWGRITRVQRFTPDFQTEQGTGGEGGI